MPPHHPASPAHSRRRQDRCHRHRRSRVGRGPRRGDHYRAPQASDACAPVFTRPIPLPRPPFGCRCLAAVIGSHPPTVTPCEADNCGHTRAQSTARTHAVIARTSPCHACTPSAPGLTSSLQTLENSRKRASAHVRPFAGPKMRLMWPSERTRSRKRAFPVSSTGRLSAPFRSLRCSSSAVMSSWDEALILH